MTDPDDVLNLSSAIVPRIFENTAHLIGNQVYFTGRGTYFLEDLIGLLPEGVSSGVMEDEPPDDYTNPPTLIVVVGGVDFDEAEIRRYVDEMGQSAMFLPEEGFLDLVLFGYDWWGDPSYHFLLDSKLDINPGLAFAKSLSGQDQFPWPSTEVEESGGGKESNQTFNATTWLFRLGYNVSNVSEVRRHQILGLAVAAKGLKATATVIASHIKLRTKQVDGKYKFRRAIEKWERDLRWLKVNYYNQITFKWPETDED